MKGRLKLDYQRVRAFLPNFDDGHLAALLDHLRAGDFSYTSCCCFIGAATADHALVKGDQLDANGCITSTPHYQRACTLFGADLAEFSVSQWMVHAGGTYDRSKSDALRTRRLIAIIKAEIRRRMRVSDPAPIEAPTMARE